MKVITLKQPWASLIVNGYKKYEFRFWKTNYRGELYIHAGKGIDKEGMKRVESLNLKYPKSRIIGKVIIEDCIELNDKVNKKINSENEFIYGKDINRKGYAWVIKESELLNIEKEINGKLGLWNIEL
ncbi:MAG: ASCH domain-containing protein [Bacilli bacterium]|nr:ASCH domain-containing protein [Bacilli bacterium]